MDSSLQTEEWIAQGWAVSWKHAGAAITSLLGDLSSDTYLAPHHNTPGEPRLEEEGQGWFGDVL